MTNRAGDPYDALASIFLPGGGSDGDDARSPAATGDADLEDLPDQAERLLRDALDHGSAPEASAAAPTDRSDATMHGGMPSGTTRPRGGRPIVETTPITTAATDDATGTLDRRGRDAESSTGSRSTVVAFPWPSRRADEGSVVLELLVPGHLPIRAAAWLVPCVRAIAGRDHAAGLFRCEDGAVELELHGPAPAPPPARSLAETIDAIRGPVRRWFLRPPNDLGIESLAEAEPDRVTILTGGDPVAVASAWEIARRVIAGADEARWTRPRLGLAVVGVPRAQAELITEQLDRITRERLGTSVDLRCCVPRIEPGGVPIGVVRGDALDADPVRLSSLVRGAPSAATSVAREAGRRADADEQATHTGHTTHPAPATPAESVDPPPMGALLGSGLADTESDAPGVPFVFPSASRGLPRVDATMPPPSIPSSSGPTLARIVPAASAASTASPANAPPEAVASSSRGEISRSGSAAGSRPEYARHVTGLRSLPARAPAHPEVELAVDDAGGLHVLGGVSTVRELPLVANWALTHAELLAMACPDREIDTSARPQGHVFTDDPLAVSDLHQSQLHLHLLAEIEVDGRRGWFVTPLHRPRG